MKGFAQHGRLHLAEERGVFGFICRAGGKDETIAEMRFCALDRAVKQITVEFRHVEVAEDGVHVPGENPFEGENAVRGSADFVLETIKQDFVNSQQFEIVLNDEDAFFLSCSRISFHGHDCAATLRHALE